MIFIDEPVPHRFVRVSEGSHRTRTAARVRMARPGPPARDCGCRSRSDEAGAFQMETKTRIQRGRGSAERMGEACHPYLNKAQRYSTACLRMGDTAGMGRDEALALRHGHRLERCAHRLAQ